MATEPAGHIHYRETFEIRTRLNRTYAKDTHNQLVWHSHKLDHTYANYVDSDRVPIVVEAGPLGESKSKKAGKSRINTEILYTQDTRRKIMKKIAQAKYICTKHKRRKTEMGTNKGKTHIDNS